MPLFSGKKTARLWLPWQICVDPFLATYVRDCAASASRSVQGQLLYFITLGVRKDALLRKEQNIISAHANSQVSDFANGE
jgi:hypothetical protein